METRTSAAWPALGWEEHRWTHRDPTASRRSQTRNRGTFRAAVAPRIASLTPVLSPHTAEVAAAATAAMTRFDLEFSHLSRLPFAAVLLRGESSTSSQIENLTVAARKLSLAAIGGQAGHNAALVAHNVNAMQAAIDSARDLSPASILRMHRELTEGVLPDAGCFRREWVWVGGESPVTAVFVAPRWEDVEPAIDDVVAFARRQDMDPTVQAAIAHAQFETVHPFTDGNGRTGRALVTSILRFRGVTTESIVPVSSGLLHDVDGYVAALAAYRAGDVEQMVLCFAQAVESALANARLLAADIEGVRELVLGSRARVTQGLRAVAEFCCTEPVFTAGMLERGSGVSVATAYRTVDYLVEAGILREESKVAGQKTWSCPALLEALDAFAARAVRRRFGR